jgi:hypothetical protein
MAKRIGEVLVGKGLLKPEELEAALKNQLILGGHLGTCCLELGFVTEGQLGEALSEVLGVPYAAPEVLRDASQDVISRVPRKMVEEYAAIPIERMRRTLRVAMVNPRDLLALDALAFATGLTIEPWVAPEVRIVEAMELHYSIPRRPRYIAIARSDSLAGPKASDDANTEAAAPETGEGPHPHEVTFDLGDDVHGDGVFGGNYDPDVRGDPEAIMPSLEELAERLCLAEERSDIAEIVVDYAASTASRALLLAVRGAEASVWGSSGFSPALTEATTPRFTITSHGFFELLLGSGHFRGPFPEQPRYRDFYELLGTESPEEVAIVPAHLNDRLVAILVVDGGPDGTVRGQTRDYLRLARILGLSLNVLIFKRKMRDVASFAAVEHPVEDTLGAPPDGGPEHIPGEEGQADADDPGLRI